MQCENVFCSQFEYNDVFLTFDTGFLLGEDEDGDKEAHIITLETKSPTTVAGSCHFFSSDTSVSTMIVIKRDNKPFLQLQPLISLSTSQSLSVDSYETAPYRSQQARSWRVQSTKRQSECSLDCHVDTCVIFRDACPIVNKSLNGVGDENHNIHHKITQRTSIS